MGFCFQNNGQEDNIINYVNYQSSTPWIEWHNFFGSLDLMTTYGLHISGSTDPMLAASAQYLDRMLPSVSTKYYKHKNNNDTELKMLDCAKIPIFGTQSVTGEQYRQILLPYNEQEQIPEQSNAVPQTYIGPIDPEESVKYEISYDTSTSSCAIKRIKNKTQIIRSYISHILFAIQSPGGDGSDPFENNIRDIYGNAGGGGAGGFLMLDIDIASIKKLVIDYDPTRTSRCIILTITTHSDEIGELQVHNGQNATANDGDWVNDLGMKPGIGGVVKFVQDRYVFDVGTGAIGNYFRDAQIRGYIYKAYGGQNGSYGRSTYSTGDALFGTIITRTEAEDKQVITNQDENGSYILSLPADKTYPQGVTGNEWKLTGHGGLSIAGNYGYGGDSAYKTVNPLKTHRETSPGGKGCIWMAIKTR